MVAPSHHSTQSAPALAAVRIISNALPTSDSSLLPSRNGFPGPLPASGRPDWGDTSSKNTRMLKTLNIKRNLLRVLAVIVAAVSGACLEATTDVIKKNFEPALISARNAFEDWAYPLPSNAIIGLTLQSFLPSAKSDEPWAEAVSATISGKSCLEPDGHEIVRAFDEAPNGHRTNAIMMIRCRPSGRVSVSLTPQSGSTVLIYDGRFKDGEKATFPGIPGSYYAGILTMYRLDSVVPNGSWEEMSNRQ